MRLKICQYLEELIEKHGGVKGWDNFGVIPAEVLHLLFKKCT